MLVGGVVFWKSVKQSLTTTSTMEAKFVSCFKATSHGMWMKSFIFVVGLMDSISRPLRIYYDNSIIAFLANNNKVVVKANILTLSI